MQLKSANTLLRSLKTERVRLIIKFALNYAYRIFTLYINVVASSDSKFKINGHLIQIMYAESEEDLASAVAKLKRIPQKKYKERVLGFLETKEEWVKLFRKDVVYRGHDTDNFSEASIRILKDIVLCRTKAYNACALADFVARVWEEYYKKRILHYAYGINQNPNRVYAKLSKRMPKGTKITLYSSKNLHEN